MTTLREAVTLAIYDAERRGPKANWFDAFSKSLRQSGYWIAPVEATPGMVDADILGTHKASSFAAMRDAYIKESNQ